MLAALPPGHSKVPQPPAGSFKDFLPRVTGLRTGRAVRRGRRRGPESKRSTASGAQPFGTTAS
jgi:hypothetical protein